MPLISGRVELKLRWKKHRVLSALGLVNADNEDSANSDKVIFTTKDTKLYVSVFTLSAKDNQKLSKLLREESERSVCWNEYKTKS